ncbi:MAG: hypothetical protein AAFZ65_18220, partial [Planctomycetota bacterium]
MRPALVFGFLTLVIAGALFWALTPTSAPPDPLTEAPSAPPPAAARPELQLSEVVHTATSAIERAEAPEPEAVERTALVDEPAAFEGEPLTVRVIDASGRLVSGAEVILLDRDRYDRKAFREAEDGLASAGERVELLRRFGVVGQTSDSGLALFQWGARRAEVFVSTEFGLERALAIRSRVEDGRLDVQIELPLMAIEFLEPDGRPVVGLACRVLLTEIRDLSRSMFSGANPFMDVDPAEITNESGR